MEEMANLLDKPPFLPRGLCCIFPLILISCLVGCTTSYRNDLKENQVSKVQEPQSVACVENPNLTRELKILKASRIFTISETKECRIRLTLKPIEKAPYPYKPLEEGLEAFGQFLTFLSLGILPSDAHEAFSFSFEISENNLTQVRTYPIYVRAKYSLWEIFRMPFIDESAILGLSLRQQYLLKEGSQKV